MPRERERGADSEKNEKTKSNLENQKRSKKKQLENRDSTEDSEKKKQSLNNYKTKQKGNLKIVVNGGII